VSCFHLCSSLPYPSVTLEFWADTLCHVIMPRLPRFQATNWALTYPRCDLAPAALLSSLREILLPAKYIKIVQEEHSEDSPLTGLHLHVVVLLESQLRTTNARFADVGTFHGDYKPLRTRDDVIRWMEYMEKEVVSCAVFGEVPPYFTAKKKESKSMAVASLLLSGSSLESLVKNPEFSGFALVNLAKMRAFMSYVKALPQPLLPWPELSLPFACPDLNRIAQWVICYVKNKSPRPLKAPQLWIWGEPSLGKSTLIQKLSQYARSYAMPITMSGSTPFLDDFDEEIIDFCYFDEFKGQYPVFFLNALTDGSRQRYQSKGGSFVKTKNLPMIVCANESPRALYHNVSDVTLAALESRFTVVNVKSFISIF